MKKIKNKWVGICEAIDCETKKKHKHKVEYKSGKAHFVSFLGRTIMINF